jgi:diguanylate cyclase (GGDEF)-like protein
MRTLLVEIELELAKPRRSSRFCHVLERRYQRDINAARLRHITFCLLLGTLSYNSFLIWKFFLQPTDFLWTAIQMLGISTPCAALVSILIRKLPIYLRETVALLPSYIGFAVVYNVIANALWIHESDQTLFIFCLPLMLIYVNTCMKSPFKHAVIFNIFALLLIGSSIFQASLSMSTGGLMLTVAGSSAFFTLLGNYWTNSEVRESYLYRLREELRAAVLRNANRNLQRLSETDALTGLANRRHMQPYLDQLWSSHLCGEAEGAVVLIDIDYFKRYNDYYGHLIGDDCLRKVAATLKKALRPQDIIARFGGEEFVVLLPDIQPSAAHDIATRLLQSIRDLSIAHLGRNDGTCTLTVSLGVAHSSTAELTDGAALLDQADRALYRAKRSGRNCIENASYTTNHS